MIPLDYLLALSLLTAPGEDNLGGNLTMVEGVAQFRSTPFILEHFATVRPTLQALALEHELMDPRECRYILNRHEDFASDLKILRRRHRELIDAPPLHDHKIFPCRETVAQNIACNRAWHNHLEQQAAFHTRHAWKLRQSALDADQAYATWDALRDASNDYYYVTVRRGALQRLRGLIGERDYRAGLMPAAVPVWLFQRID